MRKKMNESFDTDSLEKMFGNVELFLATFPKDENIEKASVRLVVATFKAIEDAIGFFVRRSGVFFPPPIIPPYTRHTDVCSASRGFSAIMNGERYQEPLLESIEQVSSCSSDLVHQAMNSHLAGTREAMNAILQGV